MIATLTQDTHTYVASEFSLPNPQTVGGAKVLGDLQAPVMHAIWLRWETDHIGSTVREVYEAVVDGGRENAYNTISTVISRLTDQNFLRATRSGGVYRYEPRITRVEYGRSVVGPIISQLRITNPQEVIEHLLVLTGSKDKD